MSYPLFLVVRTNSKRLPKKALLKIGNKPLIKILIERIVNKSNLVVCTTKNKTDDELTVFLKKHNIAVFRGSGKNILKRLSDCAQKYNVEKFIVVEADDLFCDPTLILNTWKNIVKKNIDFVNWKNVPFGCSPIAINHKKLKNLLEKKSTKNTETGWIKFIIDSGFFKVKTLTPKNKKLHRPDIRLSIDYEDDFILAKKLLKILPKDFSLEDIIDTFIRNPEFLKINELAKINYEENFEKKRSKVK